MRHLAAAELWELYDERAIPEEEDFIDSRQVRCDVVFVCTKMTLSRSCISGMAKSVVAASNIGLNFTANHIIIDRNDAAVRPLMPEPEHEISKETKDCETETRGIMARYALSVKIFARG
jgi:hypothetical protein